MDSLKRKKSNGDEPSVTSETKQTRAKHIKVEVNFELLTSGKYFDFEIKAEEHVFKVHRFAIEGKSDVIDKSIDGGFKETVERRLELHASKEAVAVLLWFMYTKEIDRSLVALRQLLNEPYTRSVFSRILIATQLHDLADYLLMPDLKVKVFDALGQIWKHAVFTLQRSKKKFTKNENLMLEKVVAYVFGEDKPFELIRKQMCWGLIELNGIERGEDQVLEDDTILHLINLFPEFGPVYLKAVRLAGRTGASCSICEGTSNYPSRLRWIRGWSFKNKPNRWTECMCGFKGLCSTECCSDDPEVCQRLAYCNDCIGDSMKECTGIRYRRDKHGLLKAVIDCNDYMDDKDTDYVSADEA